MKVGFIGLGSMGLPMAQRLLAEGHELTVWARRASTLEPFAGTAAVLAASPAEMGRSVEAVCLCVFDAAGVDEVLFGPEGLAETLPAQAVVLVHATTSAEQITALAAKGSEVGLRLLDAPVSGGAPRALVGELTIMVGGDEAALAEVETVLGAMSNHVIHLGGIGAGSNAKLVNNTLFSAQVALADDAMRAGASLGIDQAGLTEVLLTSSSSCVASGMRLHAGSIAGLIGTAGDATLIKDVQLMAATLGGAQGHELVEAAQRFVAALEAARTETKG